MGETVANLRKTFEFARARTMVLFFNEFDGIGKQRTLEDEHGELKRVVNYPLKVSPKAGITSFRSFIGCIRSTVARNSYTNDNLGVSVDRASNHLTNLQDSALPTDSIGRYVSDTYHADLHVTIDLK